MDIPHAALQQVRGLYHRGLFLQAHTLATEYGPLRKWKGIAARLLAGRLAMQLGAPRLGSALHLLAGREAPTSAEVMSYYTRAVLGFRGPMAAWKVLGTRSPQDGGDHVSWAHWLTTHTTVLEQLRDFAAAERWLAEAQEIAPDDPWVWVIQASLYGAEDCYEESLTAARHSLSLRPDYPPAVYAAAHTLTLLERDEEALDLLMAASQRMESGYLFCQLGHLQTELGQPEAARKSYERMNECLPLKDAETSSWLLAQRSDAAYGCGDYSSAAAFANQVGTEYYSRFAEDLSGHGPAGSRILLPVAFVRQHHATCCPATLTAISRFWSMPADHVEIAEEICYDGTSAYSERHWAETRGWAVREFTVSWKSATTLIDRGIPFTLATVGATQGHIQAVIGYDPTRRTLIVRDPTLRQSLEIICDAMCRDQKAHGPRGMAMVPLQRAGMLQPLELPDAAKYDQIHLLQQALMKHDRTEARRIYDAMAPDEPGHRLTLLARRSLAAYDADQMSLLSCFRFLTALYPDDVVLQLGKLSCMRDLSRRDERLALLKSLCETPDSHPVLWLTYAEELSVDAREHTTAERLIRRAIRVGYLDGRALNLLAGVLWAQERFEESLELSRFATCLNEKDENLAACHFRASYHLNRSQEALGFLRERFRRFGKRSNMPARTLFMALCHSGQTAESLMVLDTALELRPADGELLLFAADQQARFGNVGRAQALLEKAEGISSRRLWLRTAARLAQYRGDLTGSLELWREVLVLEPAAIDAHAEAADRIAETEGRSAALEHVREATSRFPHNYGLHRLWYDRVSNQEPSESETVLRRLIEINPVDEWSRRELAIRLGESRNFTEAFAELAIAGCLQPRSPENRNVAGALWAQSGRLDEAKAAWRDAIQLDIDNGFAIVRLVEACGDDRERREALAFIKENLSDRKTYGEAVTIYTGIAYATLGAEALLTQMRPLQSQRPDLFQTSSAVVRLLVDIGHLDEAIDLARQSTARFPLVQQVWFDLARALEAARDEDGARAALLRSLQIDPVNIHPIRQLVRAYSRAGQTEQARNLLETAVARDPLDPRKHLMLAQTLWEAGGRDAAVSRITRSLSLDPQDDDAWQALLEWSNEAGSPDLAVDVAREITRRRAAEPDAWLALARILSRPDDLTERFAALERAISLDPNLIPAHDLKAVLLAQAGRLDEARAICSPALWGEPVPAELAGRAAWIEATTGRVNGAIDLMSGVLARSPNYYLGWATLAVWCRDAKRTFLYLDAANRMVDLAPLDPDALSTRAHANLLIADRPGAKEDWQRAVNQAPGFVYAAYNLLRLQLEDAELKGAASTISQTRPHIQPAIATNMAIQLAFHRRDRAEVIAGFRELCLKAHPDRWPFDEAAELMRLAGWGVAMDEVILGVIEDPAANPLVGEIWAERCVTHGRWKECESRLRTLPQGSKMKRHIACAYVSSLAAGGHRRHLHRFIRDCDADLRGDAWAWGTVGSALLDLSEKEAARRWLSDWAARADAEPWMLLTLVQSLKMMGHDQEADRAATRALSLPEDGSTPHHRVWLALSDCLAGRPDEARAHMSRISQMSLPAYYQFLHALIRCMLIVQGAPAHGGKDAFRAARASLRAIRHDHRGYRRASELRRAYGDCVLRIAKDRGSKFAYLWFLYRWLKS